MACHLNKFLFALFVIFTSVSLHAESYPVLNQGELDAYYSEVYAAIGKAEMNVQELQNIIGGGQELPTWNRKLELQNAMVQLEVKKTLFANFKNSEALRSPLVRQALLQVLNIPSISQSDLAELQTLVLEEKAKIRAASAPSSSQ
ncbi:MAG: hypothetical protein ACK5MA_06185 [Parachlamydiaceae bacterium]